MEGRRGLSGRRQCRQLRAAVAGRDRAQVGPHRRADQRRGVDQRAGRRPRLRHPHLRRRGRSAKPATSRSCATPRCRMSAGRSIRATSRARSRAASSQGIGWALNEEYIYDKEGRLENPGFLDYRMPVASDLPMIETVMVEVPNPRHPYGVRGVGEVPIVPPMAAVANAIADAIGVACATCRCRRRSCAPRSTRRTRRAWPRNSARAVIPVLPWLTDQTGLCGRVPLRARGEGRGEGLHAACRDDRGRRPPVHRRR